ncbi:MAG: nucleotidyltransferase domain-containing protein [Actinomycetota bacterium]|nr:nucleotidyltransferase domain-containing protein [Actinomycetota bacterium]
MSAVMASADCYLIGSRAYGYASATSDWDILVLTPSETDMDGEHGAGVFIKVTGESDGQVIAEIVGPDKRSKADPADWAFQLRHARLLHAGWGGGEEFRKKINLAFEQRRALIAQQTRTECRTYCEQASAAQAHQEVIAAQLIAALAVRSAFQAWLLTMELPVPPDKWLPAQLRTHSGAAELLNAGSRLLTTNPTVHQWSIDLDVIRTSIY